MKDQESPEQGSESDSPLKIKRIKTSKEKIFKLVRNLLNTESFVLCYIDRDDFYQFTHGEMGLDEILAMRSYIDMEMQDASLAQISIED